MKRQVEARELRQASKRSIAQVTELLRHQFIDVQMKKSRVCKQQDIARDQLTSILLATVYPDRAISPEPEQHSDEYLKIYMYN
jgi:hypothetical protein